MLIVLIYSLVSFYIFFFNWKKNEKEIKELKREGLEMIEILEKYEFDKTLIIIPVLWILYLPYKIFIFILKGFWKLNEKLYNKLLTNQKQKS